MSEDEKCPTCKGNWKIPCDHVGTGRDEDDWCLVCDKPSDEPGFYACEDCY